MNRWKNKLVKLGLILALVGSSVLWSPSPASADITVTSADCGQFGELCSLGDEAAFDSFMLTVVLLPGYSPWLEIMQLPLISG